MKHPPLWMVFLLVNTYNLAVSEQQQQPAPIWTAWTGVSTGAKISRSNNSTNVISASRYVPANVRIIPKGKNVNLPSSVSAGSKSVPNDPSTNLGTPAVTSVISNSGSSGYQGSSYKTSGNQGGGNYGDTALPLDAIKQVLRNVIAVDDNKKDGKNVEETTLSRSRDLDELVTHIFNDLDLGEEQGRDGRKGTTQGKNEEGWIPIVNGAVSNPKVRDLHGTGKSSERSSYGVIDREVFRKNSIKTAKNEGTLSVASNQEKVPSTEYGRDTKVGSNGQWKPILAGKTSTGYPSSLSGNNLGGGPSTVLTVPSSWQAKRNPTPQQGSGNNVKIPGTSKISPSFSGRVGGYSSTTQSNWKTPNSSGTNIPFTSSTTTSSSSKPETNGYSDYSGLPGSSNNLNGYQDYSNSQWSATSSGGYSSFGVNSAGVSIASSGGGYSKPMSTAKEVSSVLPAASYGVGFSNSPSNSGGVNIGSSSDGYSDYNTNAFISDSPTGTSNDDWSSWKANSPSTGYSTDGKNVIWSSPTGFSSSPPTAGYNDYYNSQDSSKDHASSSTGSSDGWSHTESGSFSSDPYPSDPSFSWAEHSTGVDNSNNFKMPLGSGWTNDRRPPPPRRLSKLQRLGNKWRRFIRRIFKKDKQRW